MSSTLMHAYNPLPVRFTHGQGCWLWDDEEKRYLDGVSGIAVCALGHRHPDVTAAIIDQAERLLHTSNLYQIAWQQQLADALTRVSGMEKVFFCNSGAEANEAALKIARLSGHRKGVEFPEVLVMDGAFHGRTLATLSASGSRKIQAGFEPLVRGFVRVPYNDVDAVLAVAQHNKTRAKQRVVALLVEPIQGEGGVIVPDENYLSYLRRICDENEWLLMLDEVQTGVGRTGQFYAYQHSGILPDVVTSAKGLGNGIPVAACLARGIAAELFQPGNHGSTFGGNPLASRVGYTVVNTVVDSQLAKNAEQQGRKMLEQFSQALKNVSGVKAIRGQGLMLGIELDRPCRELMASGLKQGILLNVTAEKVVRLLPPLIINDEEVNFLFERVVSCLQNFLKAR